MATAITVIPHHTHSANMEFASQPHMVTRSPTSPLPLPSDIKISPIQPTRAISAGANISTSPRTTSTSPSSPSSTNVTIHTRSTAPSIASPTSTSTRSVPPTVSPEAVEALVIQHRNTIASMSPRNTVTSSYIPTSLSSTSRTMSPSTAQPTSISSTSTTLRTMSTAQPLSPTSTSPRQIKPIPLSRITQEDQSPSSPSLSTRSTRSTIQTSSQISPHITPRDSPPSSKRTHVITTSSPSSTPLMPSVEFVPGLASRRPASPHHHSLNPSNQNMNIDGSLRMSPQSGKIYDAIQQNYLSTIDLSFDRYRHSMESTNRPSTNIDYQKFFNHRNSTEFQTTPDTSDPDMALWQQQHALATEGILVSHHILTQQQTSNQPVTRSGSKRIQRMSSTMGQGSDDVKHVKGCCSVM